MLQTVIFFFLALFPLVVVHELGHFLVAKLNKVHVEEFGLGFPPRLARLFHHGGTDYTLNALPLGGFVRLAGEEDPTVEGAFAAKPKRVRAAVLAAGPSANFLFAALVLALVAMWDGIPTPLDGIRAIEVASVEDGEPAAEAGMAAGDLIVAVDGVRLADVPVSDGPAPEMTYLQEVTQNAADTAVELDVLRLAEPPFAVSDSEVESATTAPYSAPWFEGLRVEDASASSSVRAGDILVGSARGHMAVLRGLEERHISVTPVADDATGVPRIGIGMGIAAMPIRPGIGGALRWGGSTTVAMITQLATALTEMVSGQRAPEISGPVGIAKISRQQAELGLMAFLLFLSVLSVNLGLINLLPIPALDGGRLLFVGLEALRGRRINPAREQLVHLIGFALVIGLMAFITVAEVLPALGWHLP